MGVKRNHDDTELESKLEDASKITEDEAALYDRQIRLWGIDCQRRLREANILVIGMNGVGAEVVKNLTLSGVRSITILDDTPVEETDFSAQFFVSGTERGKRRSGASLSAIQELNPNVKISVKTGDPNIKTVDFFEGYDAVFTTGLSLDMHSKFNNFCRELNIQFYCADTWGLYGYCFLDLNNHKFMQVVSKSETLDVSETASKIITIKDGEPSTSKEKKVMEEKEVKYYQLARTLLAKVGEGLRTRVNRVFVLLHIVNHFREIHMRYPLPEYRNQDIKELLQVRDAVCTNLKVDSTKVPDETLSCLFGELSPVCAVIGGVLANEMIKGISRTGLPIYNYFLFDGNESIGANELVKSNLDDKD